MDHFSTPDLVQIFANLSEEICRPLDMLRFEIDQLRREADSFESEMCQAETMLVLCDDLSRLTRETLVPTQQRQA